MSIGFPTNTVILLIATMLAVGAGSWFILARGLSQLPVEQNVKRNWRWGAALVLLTWLLVLLALAMNPPGGPVLGGSVVITSLGLGLLAGSVPLLFSPVFRQAVYAVPATWLIGLHAIRLAGFSFLALLDMKLLPAEFALPTGYGDMTVALLAIAVVYLFVQGKPRPEARLKGHRFQARRGLAIGWNLLGLLDFTVALTTGLTYIQPFAAQLAASGVSLQYLNYVLLVPSFPVPLFTLLHLYSLVQLLSGRVGETKPGIEEPVQTSVFLGEQRSAHP